MKRNKTYRPAGAVPTDPAAILADIGDIAVSFSVESRRIVRAELDDVIIEDLPPHDSWLALLRDRDEAGHRDRLHAAAKSLAKLAPTTTRPFVPGAARRLVEAVCDLARWRPDHELQTVEMVPCRFLESIGLPDGYGLQCWHPTAASVANLDELRHKVWAAYVAVEELPKDYPDTAARVLVVAKRIAERIFEPTDARLLTTWFAKLAAGDGAAA